MGDVPTSSGTDLPAVPSSHPGSGLDALQLQNQVIPGDIASAYTLQLYPNTQQPYNPQFDMAQPQIPARAGPYNMNALANALPQNNYRQGPYNPSQMRYNPTGASPTIATSGQQIAPYNGQPPMGQMPSQAYYVQQQPQMSPYYNTPMSPSQPQPNMSPRPNMPFYGNQVMSNHQGHPSMAYYYTQMGPFQPQGQPQHQGIPGAYMAAGAGPHDPRLGSQQGGDCADGVPFSPTQQESLQGSSDARSNVVRGPPRKPRQCGHAIWIGNLPSQTDLMGLVHHVCKEAEGLESLFLISKSNCAFANYKDETSCLEAQQKLHESKFQSVRLVSRLRKNTVEGASGITAPTGPAATTPQPPTAPEPKEKVFADAAEVQPNRSENGTPSVTSGPETNMSGVVEAAAQKDKFFILKSLTVEDLELSVRQGIWATQSHNEGTLNTAFKDAENVYLVFSANKSGEYFGYARMVSTINEDPAAAIEFAPKVQFVSDVNLPKEILTEAAGSTPKGRIIDDSARGTIFWEVLRDDMGDGQDGTESDQLTLVAGEQEDANSAFEGGADNKTWGKPFKLEWLCTTRLPFYRCRGLRNPWNSNREVKIARDGTELEPSVGRRLIGLFNRNHNSPAPRGPMVAIGQMPLHPAQQGIPLGYPPPYA